MTLSKVSKVIKYLLAWYDKSQRHLPWRYSHFDCPNPYYTWVSEIMLQQTTVAIVIEYFNRFIKKWPHLESLSQAKEDEVLTLWQGLGYYTRARNLLKCAQQVVNDYQSTFPSTAEELIKLPGIGLYTAKAIAAIAFRQKEVPIDGNIVRVFTRLYGLETPLPDVIKEVEIELFPYKDNPRPGDFAQALMDLGAMICLPKNPKCFLCPIKEFCNAYQKGVQEHLPRRASKIIKPRRYGKAFIILDTQGQVLLRKRAARGLLANMMEVPTTLWGEEQSPLESSLEKHLLAKTLLPLPGLVKHAFTHFHLELEVFRGTEELEVYFSGIWVPLTHLHTVPLPTLIKKVLRLSLGSII